MKQSTKDLGCLLLLLFAVFTLAIVCILFASSSARADSSSFPIDDQLESSIRASQYMLELDLAKQKYQYINRDVFNQESRIGHHDRHGRYDDDSDCNEDKIYINESAKTFSYQPYRPDVFNTRGRR